MELIIVLAILGGLWAALLLPSFLDSRNDAPIASTRDFDRNIARLASVSVVNVDPVVLARRRILTRRRRILLALAATAVVTLAVSLWRDSTALLIVSLVADGLLLAYIRVLMRIRARAAAEPLAVAMPLVGRFDDDDLSAIGRP